MPSEQLTEVCERCGGKGKISYRTIGDAMPRDIGNGVQVQDMGGWGTRACECVRDLAPVDDKATWWESEIVWSEVWDDSILPDSVLELEVSAEVPRRADGRRVVMRGNRYYPTWLDVILPNGDKLMLHPEQARGLALKLMAGALACEAVDEPCTDECGHWWPCDCQDPNPEERSF